jgi:hypothetical protein
MDTNQRLFAFQLAAKQDRVTSAAQPAQGKWQARDGVAVAGCTDPKANGVLREAFPWGDGRAYC